MRFDCLLNSNSLKFCIALAGLMLSTHTLATTVQFQTSLGEFEVVLFDQEVPLTVANFLSYVEGDSYTDSIVHRSIPGFVVQGGGFIWQDDLVTDLVTDNPVMNEPVYSNVSGTIAMAKLASDPNSATSQWFINLDDNSENLDRSNGGFTVFGQVVGAGMDVVNAISDVPTFNFGGAFTNFPLADYSTEDAQNEVPLTTDNVIIIQSVSVIDAAEDTLGDLEPVLNESLEGETSGGGAFSLFDILIFSLVLLFFQTRRRHA